MTTGGCVSQSVVRPASWYMTSQSACRSSIFIDKTMQEHFRVASLTACLPISFWLQILSFMIFFVLSLIGVQGYVIP